jgi:hypothetical protein
MLIVMASTRNNHFQRINKVSHELRFYEASHWFRLYEVCLPSQAAVVQKMLYSEIVQPMIMYEVYKNYSHEVYLEVLGVSPRMVGVAPITSIRLAQFGYVSRSMQTAECALTKCARETACSLS